jgi:hypothetical protein
MKYLFEKTGAQTVLQKWYGPKYAFCPGGGPYRAVRCLVRWPKLVWGCNGLAAGMQHLRDFFLDKVIRKVINYMCHNSALHVLKA